MRTHIIPNTQAAYTEGRSTTELVFAFKILAEKAITSSEYEINLLMLDMSKAFDTIQRGYLFDDLKQILNPDKLCLIHLLLDNVEIAVKLENELGELFKSLIGSPQGDAASALFFIIYLATILRKSKIQIENKENPIVPHLQDHNYAKSNSRQHLEEHNYSKNAPRTHYLYRRSTIRRRYNLGIHQLNHTRNHRNYSYQLNSRPETYT